MMASSAVAAHGDEQKEGALDEAHLRRMTLGDRNLEREVLEIFARQTTIMLGRIAQADPAQAAAAAHTLKGSARGIGAWRVVRAAERLEEAAAGAGDLAIAKAAIEAAGAEIRAAIGARLNLGAHAV
jgi:HPt (histidine-containing phosphotransfer) domain-containing protein